MRRASQFLPGLELRIRKARRHYRSRMPFNSSDRTIRRPCSQFQRVCFQYYSTIFNFVRLFRPGFSDFHTTMERRTLWLSLTQYTNGKMNRISQLQATCIARRSRVFQMWEDFCTYLIENPTYRTSDTQYGDVCHRMFSTAMRRWYHRDSGVCLRATVGFQMICLVKLLS